MTGINCCVELNGQLKEKKLKESAWPAWIGLFLSAVVIVIYLISIENFGVNEADNDSSKEFDWNTIEIIKDFAGKASTPLQNRTIHDRGRLVIVPRRHWVAQPPVSTTLLENPVKYVVISQTSTDSCSTRGECTLTVRNLQVLHVEIRKWLDIAYNFMVAGDGLVYHGRGWDVVGAHTSAVINSISFGISFVGTFSDVIPPIGQIMACKRLIRYGIRIGKISPNYKLIADRQLRNSGNPGQRLYEELQTWKHWTSEVR